MKVTKMILVILLIAGSIGYAGTPAQAKFASYVSGITMQNLSSSPANTTITFYDQAGNVVGTPVQDTIPAYGVKDYSTIPVASCLNCAAIISSNYEIGAVSTLRGDSKGRGIYTGAKSGAQAVSLPILMKNWGSSAWNTWISVQNVGSSPADIIMDYAACAGSNDEQVLGVKPGAAAIFDQAAETCFTNAKTLTSGVVNSTQNISVIVAQESLVVNSSLVSSGFVSFAKNPVIPLMNSNNPDINGWRTAISVFNNGGQATDVTLTYVKASDGTTCTETQNIPSKGSKVFAGNNLITGQPFVTCPAGGKLVGSAWVSGNSTNQDLVATVNQDRGSLASAYGALSPTVASPKVVFPQIQDRNGLSSNWASSLMVMNIGGGPTFVKCTFTNTSYSPQSGQLNSYKAWEDLQRDKIAPSYVGSGQCTAYTSNTYTTVDTAAKIIAVVNIRGTGVGLYDLMMSYEGLNVVP